MKKGTKIFLALLVVVALALGGVSVFYSQQLTEQTQTIAKKHLHHFLSIAARLKDLQDALLDKLFQADVESAFLINVNSSTVATKNMKS